MLRTQCLIGLCLLLSGCSASAPSEDETTESSTELRSAQHLSRKAELTCEGAACPEGVGMLVHIETANKKVETAQCTLTLVEADLVMADSRCVPLKRRQNGTSLKGRVWAVFAGSAKAAGENLEADQVISIDGQFAFVRLAAASKHPVARLSAVGLAEDLELKVVKVSPAADPENELSGELVTDTCRIGEGASATSPTAPFEDCELTAAETGSPLFDKSGAVRAMSRPEPGRLTNLGCVWAPHGLLGSPHAPCTASDER